MFFLTLGQLHPAPSLSIPLSPVPVCHCGVPGVVFAELPVRAHGLSPKKLQ